MSEEIIGYRYRYDNTWEPVYPVKPGMVSTQAIMSCHDCDIMIRASGGGGSGYLCPDCYNKFKLVNFTKGNNPV